MEKIDMYIKNNKLLASLMHFFVEINILKNDSNIYFKLKVIDENRKEVVFNFYTLEDAISFINNIIINCRNIKEIINNYKKLWSLNEFTTPNINNDIKITLTPDEVIQAIIEYFGKDKNYGVSGEEEIEIINNKFKIKYYLIEYIDTKKNKSLLTKGDLTHVIDNYIKFYNYELIDFNYNIKGNKYEGIELTVKEKGKKKTLTKGE